MVDQQVMERIKNCLAQGQRFAITTHVNPDGDGLGAEAALANFLEERGKDVYIFNSNPVPDNYDFLNPDKKFLTYDPRKHQETLLTVDYILIVDISDWQRLRQVGRDIRDISTTKICIDHHPSQEKVGEVRLVDQSACSTGEIVYQLIEYCGGPFNKTIAEALYTCLVTDTGSFKFSNTTAKSFEIAGKLIEHGANTHELYQKIYERQSYNKVKLFAYVLNNLHFEKSGRVAWFAVTYDVIENLGVQQNDTEGFSDYPRVIDGVEVTVMFVETEKGTTKVSLRSKGNVIINKIAQEFGGGGHPFAAGIMLNGGYKEYKDKLLSEVYRLFT